MVLENILITTHVNASAGTLHHANAHGIITLTHAGVPVNLMVVTEVNTLTMRAAAVSVRSTRPVRTINISTVPPVNVYAMM